MKRGLEEPPAYQNSASGCSADPVAVAAAAGPASSSDEERGTGLEVRGLGGSAWQGGTERVWLLPFGGRTVPKVEGVTAPQVSLCPGSRHRAQHPDSDVWCQGFSYFAAAGIQLAEKPSATGLRARDFFPGRATCCFL